jgi:alpha-1,3-rhamnosyl/mannosyltransferase
VWAENTWLVSAAQQAGVELMHHGGGTLPTRGRGRRVLTVHDLQYRDNPQLFSPAKRTYLRLTMPRSLRAADVVATPSEFVRSSVLAAVDRDPASVIVVDHPIPAPLAGTGERELRERYRLPGPIVVFPAITYLHKNHRVLIAALAALGEAAGDLRLVLLGAHGPAEAALQTEIARAGVSERVVRPGRVGEADRNGLLAMAAALVFPSRYEGFGAPVIEAMHLGCPVVASNVTALPEVVADAGRLIGPDDIDGWATAMRDAASGALESLRAAGLRRAQDFDGRSTATQLATAYRRALS